MVVSSGIWIGGSKIVTSMIPYLSLQAVHGQEFVWPYRFATTYRAVDFIYKLCLAEIIQIVGFRQVYCDTPHVSFFAHPDNRTNQFYFTAICKVD